MPEKLPLVATKSIMDVVVREVMSQSGQTEDIRISNLCKLVKQSK